MSQTGKISGKRKSCSAKYAQNRTMVRKYFISLRKVDIMNHDNLYLLQFLILTITRAGSWGVQCQWPVWQNPRYRDGAPQHIITLSTQFPPPVPHRAWWRGRAGPGLGVMKVPGHVIKPPLPPTLPTFRNGSNTHIPWPYPGYLGHGRNYLLVTNNKLTTSQWSQWSNHNARSR